MSSPPHRRRPARDSAAHRRGPGVASRRSGASRGPLLVLLLAGLLAAGGCDDAGSSGPETTDAVLAVEGRVVDASDAGVESAGITITLHETADCSSAVLREIAGTSGFEGGFSAVAGIPDVESDFEPRDVCLDFRADPPESRPELGPAERGGLVGTLRSRDGGQPIDTVEVEITLPETGAG